MHSPLRDDEMEPDAAEREANAFAGALLLPAEAAIKAMRPPLTLTTLANVKATYGVSIGMCAYRAKHLGLISDERHVSLRKQLTSRGWHRDEPVPVAQENTLLIRRVLELVGQGKSDIERAASVTLPPFAYRALAAAN
jgi:Zn-dependent peptidase ImmA (M78 family)